MEGVQPVPSPPSPAPWLTPKRIVLVLVVAALVVGGISAYLVTRTPPIPLTLRDGSTMRAIMADFANMYPPLILRADVKAVSTANESGGAVSSLALEALIVGWTVPNPNSTTGGTWHMEVDTFATGAFTPNLGPTAIALTANGSSTDAQVASQTLYLGGTNASFSPSEKASFIDNGSATVSATLVNRSSSVPSYDFAFEDLWAVNELVDYNGTYGFRATVTGPFTPAVSVGIRLVLINVTNTPPQAIGASISVSSNGVNWIVTFAAVPGGLSNATTDLSLTDSSGRTVVPATALGSLYLSSYHASISYIPASAGSSAIEVGDKILLARATYPSGDHLEITTSSMVLYSTTLQ